MIRIPSFSALVPTARTGVVAACGLAACAGLVWAGSLSSHAPASEAAQVWACEAAANFAPGALEPLNAFDPQAPDAKPEAKAPADEAETIKAIRGAGDSASPELIKNLANFKTRTAMTELVELYGKMSTIFMKREIVRSLAKFDGVSDAEQPALDKIRDVATLAKEVELRTAAVDALGECGVHGKDYLVTIIESAAEDQIRERAMRAHVKLHTKDDLNWYKELYKPKKKEEADKDKKGGKKDPKKPEPKKPKGKDDKGKDDKEPEAEPEVNKKGRIIPVLRLIAFDALVSNMTPEECAEATLDPNWKVRLAAYEELDRRQDPKLAELAQKTLEKTSPRNPAEMDVRFEEMPTVRVFCARIVARVNGVKAAPDFIKRGQSVETPEELRNELADLVASFNDPATNKQLILDLAGRGSAEDKLFLIRATKGIDDDKVSKALEHLLTPELDPKKAKPNEIAVPVNAIRAIAERKQKDAVDKLSKLIGKNKERNVMRAALEALSQLRKDDPKWIDELFTLTKNEDAEVRNLALQALAQTKSKDALKKLVEFLDDPSWSVRLAALDALEHMRSKDAVGPIIARMAKEEGRMLQEFSLALWRMTGQGFQENASGWSNWWKGASDKFEFLSEEQLNTVASGEEEYRLRQSTRVEQKFFGIRIVSHRCIFIIDVSGSMEELLNSEYEGKAGQQRIEVAKRELERCVLGLDASALFNIITFSSDVDRWIDGSLAAANEKNRNEAKAFAGKLKAGGGTNLFGAVKEAFKDLDVDTIFILSDGEPSVGETIDPLQIREQVKSWNEHRGIQINTIAVGGQFQVLEWLAADSGGTHVSFD